LGIIKYQLRKVERTEGPIPRVTLQEIEQQLEVMANNKSTSPEKVPFEVIKSLKCAGIEWKLSILAEV